MKIFKLMAIALVAMLGFTACDKDCDHNFIEHDYSEALVGTWTYLEGEQAEAMVINPDGSFATTGIMKGGALYEEKGTISVINNKVSLVFEGDKDVIEGRLELVAGKSMSIVINEEYDIRLTYDYCEKDLSDEIVGMWVCTEDVYGKDKSIAITTYNENGKAYLTGFSPDVNGFVKQEELDYKVVGNLMISSLKGGDNMPTMYFPVKFDIMPNGTELGDIMTTHDLTNGTKPSFLRVKQNLNLAGKAYYYKSAYVTNAKGTDEDFTILGNTFNMANIHGGNFDTMFGADLYSVELNTNTITLKSRPYGQDTEIKLPITVDGNKVTINLSTENPAFRNVDMYMFQDANDSQLHMYMPTQSFINYFANMEIFRLLGEGKINSADATAIEKIYTDLEAHVESINVSFVMKARK